MKLRRKLPLVLGFAIACICAADVSRANTMIVTNTNDAGSGSLRQAIIDANATTDFDTIQFAIDPDTGAPQTIQLNQVLPPITSPIFIDGWSQAGADVVGIAIRGTFNFPANVPMLYLKQGSGSIIRGLAINNTKMCFQNDADQTEFYGNYVGLDLDGETLAQCAYYGIVSYGNGFLLGGEGNKRNVITGQFGVYLGGGQDIQIWNNIIGLTVSGEPVSNISVYYRGLSGIIADGVNKAQIKGNIVGDHYTDDAGEGASWVGGICVKKTAKKVVIEDNFIGVGLDGKSPRSNEKGITVIQGAEDVVIQNNVISGNQESGLLIIPAEVVDGGVSNIKILNNIIGLSAQGEWVVSDDGKLFQLWGVRIRGGDGLTMGPDNIISGNAGAGVLLLETAGVDISGNMIGLGLNAQSSYSNGKEGIRVSASVNSRINNNTIANNQTDGVSVGTNSKRIDILNNSIFDNKGLGINLIPSGSVNINDIGDTDSGPNDLLNFPVVKGSAAKFNATTHVLQMVMKLDIDAPFAKVQAFANTSPDQSGYGEGKTYLGETTVSASTGFQIVSIAVASNIPASAIKNVALTATATEKGTSEFSAVIQKIFLTEERELEAVIDKWVP